MSTMPMRCSANMCACRCRTAAPAPPDTKSGSLRSACRKCAGSIVRSRAWFSMTVFMAPAPACAYPHTAGSAWNSRSRYASAVIFCSTSTSLTLEEVAAAVDAVCPAIEIVDDRNADYSGLDALSLIADNSWNAGIVLGEFVQSWPDLAAIEGVVSVDGVPADRGIGARRSRPPFPCGGMACRPSRRDGNRIARRGHRHDRKPGDDKISGSAVGLSF